MSDLIKNEISSKFTNASNLLGEGKFKEAKIIYEELLTNDPSCLTALAGKLFAEDEIGGIKEFRLDNLVRRDIPDKTRAYMAQAGGNDEFFKKYERCLNIAHKMKARNEEIASLKSQAEGISVPKDGENFDKSKYNIGGLSPEEYESKQMNLAIGFAALAVICLGIAIFLTPYAYIAFALAGAYAAYKYSRMVKAINIQSEIESLTARVKSNQRRLGGINLKLNELLTINQKETKAFDIHVERMNVLLDSYEIDYDVLSGMKKPGVVNKLEVSDDDRKAGLFAHTCPNCSGKLEISEDGDYYICVSCGSKFEMEYFMSDELTNTINSSLEQKEFISATDMCEFALSKNPNDIRAKFFKLLAEDEIGGMMHLNSKDLASREIKSHVSKYMIGEYGNRKLLFDEYLKGIKAGQQMRELKESVSNLNKKISDANNNLFRLKGEYAKYAELKEQSYFSKELAGRDKDLEHKLEEKRRLETEIASLESVIKSYRNNVADLNKKITAESKKVGAAVIKMKEILRFR